MGCEPPPAIDVESAFAGRDAMMAIEAIVFAAARPVAEAELAPFVPRGKTLASIIDAIRAEIGARPYDLEFIAGGWTFRTRAGVADAIRRHQGLDRAPTSPLSEQDMIIVAAIAYAQPITRAQISAELGKEISRDALARIKRLGVIASGPRSPGPGAPISYVTTRKFLEMFGLTSLADLPDPDIRGPVADASGELPTTVEHDDAESIDTDDENDPDDDPPLEPENAS